MDGSDVAAIVTAAVSAAIAAGSLFVATRALFYSGRADERATRAEERAERAEHRAEQGLPSARYLGFEQQQDVLGDAVPLVDSIGFRFLVTNVGPAGARHITVHVTDGSRTERSSGVNLAPGDESDDFLVGVPKPKDLSYPLKVFLRWWPWEPDSSRTEPLERPSSVEVPDPFIT
jgi:hypothetical protein